MKLQTRYVKIFISEDFSFSKLREIIIKTTNLPRNSYIKLQVVYYVKQEVYIMLVSSHRKPEG